MQKILIMHVIIATISKCYNANVLFLEEIQKKINFENRCILPDHLIKVTEIYGSGLIQT